MTTIPAALAITRSGTALTATLDHPPLNLLDGVFIPGLKGFLRTVATDETTQVIVFASAVQGFFAAHVDAAYGADPAAFMARGEKDLGHEGLTPMQHLVASVRALPQVTIAKLRGHLRGGGNELAMAADLSYAAAGETWMGQIEGRMTVALALSSVCLTVVGFGLAGLVVVPIAGVAVVLLARALGTGRHDAALGDELVASAAQG